MSTHARVFTIPAYRPDWRDAPLDVQRERRARMHAEALADSQATWREIDAAAAACHELFDEVRDHRARTGKAWPGTAEERGTLMGAHGLRRRGT